MTVSHFRFYRLLVVAVFSLYGTHEVTATEPASASWLAGFACSKVTPVEPVMLGGYAARTQPFTRVDCDVHVKALALRDAAGNEALLLTCDLVGFRAELARPLIARVAAATGLEPARIILNASHNHTGPSASTTAGAVLNQEQADRILRYHGWLMQQIVDTAITARRDLAPAELAYGSGLALFAVNRREPTPTGIKLGFNPRGPTDRTVPVLRVTGSDGRVRGIVFGAACHPTTIPPRENAVDGDYPGYAQAYLEEQHPGAQAMFVQGFGGDTGPFPTGKGEYARQHGVTLAQEVIRVLGSPLAPVRGSLRAVRSTARLPLDPPRTLAEVEALTASPQLWQKLAAGRMLARWHEGVRPLQSYEAPFTVWQFGDDLTLAALPGEVVADYAIRLAAALGPLRLWLVGYANDVFGYLPSARLLREGGYETRGIYSGEKFAPEVEEQVVAHVVKLAHEAGRVPIPVSAP